MRAARKTAMPMISRYSRPLATTPTIPSAIAAITSSKKRAIMPSSVSFGRSAAGQQPFAVSARLVRQAVVLEDRLFIGCGQFAVRADRRGVLHLFPVVGDLEVFRTDGRPGQGHEYEPVPGRHADLDRA